MARGDVGRPPPVANPNAPNMDVQIGTQGDDELFADPDGDIIVLVGRAGNDTIDGGAVDPRIAVFIGGAGNDAIDGSRVDADILVMVAGGGNDTIDGGGIVDDGPVVIVFSDDDIVDVPSVDDVALNLF